MYAIKPAIEPTIIPSFTDDKVIQLYLYNNQTTIGAIKHKRKINEYIPMYGIIVITPAIAPKNALNIDICLNNIKL